MQRIGSACRSVFLNQAAKLRMLTNSIRSSPSPSASPSTTRTTTTTATDGGGGVSSARSSGWGVERMEKMRESLLGMQSSVRTMNAKIASANQSFRESVKDAVQDLHEDIRENIQLKTQGLSDSVSSKTDALKQSVVSAKDSLADAVSTRAEVLKDTVKDKVEDVREDLASVKSSLWRRVAPVVSPASVLSKSASMLGVNLAAIQQSVDLVLGVGTTVIAVQLLPAPYAIGMGVAVVLVRVIRRMSMLALAVPCVLFAVFAYEGYCVVVPVAERHPFVRQIDHFLGRKDDPA
ncbi:mitochondrial Apolipoprotein A1/A4/E domain-containing protein [Andalucia godoyi]|uniref:Mitochondrial Apolipoprotein A1/A4/E domain-containing protein n=1 Tax=Andalucia godoyi TaxID=505711 RepID=A0A8K0AJ08_ANDGO|nr:mitochondrial Apolipoprotein A1/A4/E domain-containing protein [Andalucia godoyi]|eukprot:ANDGO_03383.mRNA.1 mitochondrial Apolipoprotein A1/A4/E domain-containing protein